MKEEDWWIGGRSLRGTFFTHVAMAAHALAALAASGDLEKGQGREHLKMGDFRMMIGVGAAQPTNNGRNIEMNLLGIECMHGRVAHLTAFALAGR